MPPVMVAAHTRETIENAVRSSNRACARLQVFLACAKRLVVRWSGKNGGVAATPPGHRVQLLQNVSAGEMACSEQGHGHQLFAAGHPFPSGSR
jgi:hypothetical protein